MIFRYFGSLSSGAFFFTSVGNRPLSEHLQRHLQKSRERTAALQVIGCRWYGSTSVHLAQLQSLMIGFFLFFLVMWLVACFVAWIKRVSDSEKVEATEMRWKALRRVKRALSSDCRTRFFSPHHPWSVREKQLETAIFRPPTDLGLDHIDFCSGVREWTPTKWMSNRKEYGGFWGRRVIKGRERLASALRWWCSSTKAHCPLQLEINPQRSLPKKMHPHPVTQTEKAASALSPDNLTPLCLILIRYVSVL